MSKDGKIKGDRPKTYRKIKKWTVFDTNWNMNYLRLKDFKARFGHCNVKEDWLEDKPLGRWVIRQRVYKSRLTPDRLEKLDGLGFVWNTYDADWVGSFRELVAFRDTFGHCQPSKGDAAHRKLAD